MKIIIQSFIILLFSTSLVMADSIKLKYNEQTGRVDTQGIKVEQVQTKLRCVFQHKKRGGFKISRRYPFTQISNSTYEGFDIKIKKSSLREFLPGFSVFSCAYVLITLGKDRDGKSRFGDIVLMGKIQGDMTERELDFMANQTNSNEYLNKRIDNLVLGFGSVRGKPRIIDLSAP